MHKPLIAKYRTVHIDLACWPACPPTERIQRVTLLLQPSQGQPLGLTAQPHDETGRHYTLQLTDDPHAVSWLPPGRCHARVLVWAAGQQNPEEWTVTHNGNGDETALTLEITDEPRRPTASTPKPPA